jgi:hypothetical protein
MVCKSGNRTQEFDIFYDSEKLEVVRTFTYLSVTLSSNGRFYQAQKSLSNQALKALFSLNALLNESVYVVT